MTLASLISLAVLFFWVFLSSFGIPGGLVAMISSGALANNLSNLINIILVSAIAAILGDILAYELARKFSLPISKKIRKFKFFINHEIQAREYLCKYEFFTVFITRFLLTGLCAVTSYISGFEKLNRKKYILAVITGEVLYALIYTAAGFAFKLAWNDLVNIINDFIILTILIAITLLLIWIIIRKMRKRNKNIQIYDTQK